MLMHNTLAVCSRKNWAIIALLYATISVIVAAQYTDWLVLLRSWAVTMIDLRLRLLLV